MPDLSTPLPHAQHIETLFDADAARRKLHVILNPAANKGVAAKYAQIFRRWFSNERHVELQLTENTGDATRLAEASTSSIVAACGGDGTVNEVAQSLVHTDRFMACVPLGSGNDFFRNVSGKNAAPPNPESLFALFHRAPKTIDTALASFFQTPEHPTARYFLNSLGLGFTGRIAAVASRFKRLRGDLIYAYALWHVARTFRAVPMRIEIVSRNGTMLIDDSIFALSVGNGKREGGKFWIAPQAEMTDGLIDVCILKAFPMWQLPQFVLLYLQGKQLTHRNVIYAQATKLTVELSCPETMHLDGEVFEGIVGKLCVEVRPRSLNVVVAH